MIKQYLPMLVAAAAMIWASNNVDAVRRVIG